MGPFNRRTALNLPVLDLGPLDGRSSVGDDLPVVQLGQGELFVETEPHLVSTILGSCVAVCLWDRRLRYGGMTHSVLPRWPANVPPTARYTDLAIDALFLRMRQLGSRPADIQAKLFGGGNVLGAAHGSDTVGSLNVAAALDQLRQLKLPIMARHVLGSRGVIIKQDTGTGTVWLRRIAPGGLTAAIVP